MAWSHRWPLPADRIKQVLWYFDKYDYPVTTAEAALWQTDPEVPVPTPPRKINKIRNFFVFAGRQETIRLRHVRRQSSLAKWALARSWAGRIGRLPFIRAVYVTGALAMNNCPAGDDIDLMFIVRAHTLWLVRPLVLWVLAGHRRLPGQTAAPDRVCPNLWLDERHLQIASTPNWQRNLYLAHEILQAKCAVDRGEVHHRFLRANSWVNRYLPAAYQRSWKNLRSENRDMLRNSKLEIGDLVLWPLNLLFFAAQYWYMFPKKTTERVGLGFAFFHPQKYS